MWDDLGNFHKPHEYLSGTGKNYKIDKKLKHESTKAGKYLRKQKIQHGKSVKVSYTDYDFMQGF